MGRRALLSAVAAAALAASGPAAPPRVPGRVTGLTAAARAEPAPAGRRAYFGELHLHTGYSFDAYMFMGARSTPEEAYRYARGEPIAYLGQTIRRPRPLDFAVVTDHAEFMGVFNQLDDPASELSRSPLAAQLRDHPLQVLRALTPQTPGLNAPGAMASTWTREVEAANRNYQPGRFTTFVAYEWTAMGEGKYNLHRNVIFKDAPPEAPFNSVDSARPEDLWSYLERLRARGIEALAIPHNANASGGLMFDWKDSEGRAISEAYAQRRATNEPLTEVFQTKGQSETAPELSPNDEFADFEVIEKLFLGGRSAVDGSYARQALGRGLVVRSKVGANPFKLGFVGGGDFHNGLSNADENAYAGEGEFATPADAPPPERARAAQILGVPAAAGGAAGVARLNAVSDLLHGSGGLTGVWAEANTREAIYAALRRRETFATSGPEIRLRFFGGWKVAPGTLASATWVSTAYRTATPMGGDLPAVPPDAGSPGFIVQAAKDPLSGNLDRIQIVKVWLKDGDYREKVFDVVWSPERRRAPRTGRVPAVRNTVDLATATYSNSVGAATLSGVWRDPEFDPKTPAVYYARALEIPTPRWSTILAVRRKLPLPAEVPATIQERAVSSPIWFTPPAPATGARR